LNAAGLVIEDFGGDGEFVASGNRNRFYTNAPSHCYLVPGSLVFRPMRIMPGLRRNHLWHPVKPLRDKLGGIQQQLQRKMAAFLRSLTAG